MSDAESEAVPPDLARAQLLLGRAKEMLADADNAELSLAASVVLNYQAMLSAIDAVLAADGMRITSGVGSHVARIRECARILGAAYDDLMARVDEWRRDRAAVAYDLAEPSASDVAALQSDARDVVAAAERHVKGSG